MALILESAATSAGVTSLKHLTEEEKHQICRQFSCEIRLDDQLLWSAVGYNISQKWAKDHGMQTFTMAMGPLMITDHPLCQRNGKVKRDWINYIHGASAIFAWYISKGTKVAVLLPPPPNMYHPALATSYQTNEEPILKLRQTGFTIYAVHPTVEGAESWPPYQIWPNDETRHWIARFGERNDPWPWRNIRGYDLTATGIFVRRNIHAILPEPAKAEANTSLQGQLPAVSANALTSSKAKGKAEAANISPDTAANGKCKGKAKDQSKLKLADVSTSTSTNKKLQGKVKAETVSKKGAKGAASTSKIAKLVSDSAMTSKGEGSKGKSRSASEGKAKSTTSVKLKTKQNPKGAKSTKPEGSKGKAISAAQGNPKPKKSAKLEIQAKKSKPAGNIKTPRDKGRKPGKNKKRGNEKSTKKGEIRDTTRDHLLRYGT